MGSIFRCRRGYSAYRFRRTVITSRELGWFFLEREYALQRHIEPVLALPILISMEQTVVAVNWLRLAMWSIGIGT